MVLWGGSEFCEVFWDDVVEGWGEVGRRGEGEGELQRDEEKVKRKNENN